MRQVFLVIKLALFDFIDRWRLLKHRAKWKSLNKHNLTNAGTVFPIDKVQVDRGSYGTLNVISYGNKDEKLEIGKFCSIAGQVKFILSGEHNYHKLSTYPFGKIVINGNVEASTKGKITLGDDVWIGYGTIILSGVTIGRGAVVGAGSVVFKDIPEYAIYAGTKIVGYRFDSPIIEKIKKIEYSIFSDQFIKDNFEYLNMEIDNGNVDTLISKLLN